MWRCLVGFSALCCLAACNQLFGIPGVTQSNGTCGAQLATCAPDATCSESSSTCTCNAGYTGDGATCTDVDECAASTAMCTAHASCTNTPGAFTCACDAGFAGDGASSCVPTTFTKIAAAGGFTCGLAGDGGVYCWGANYYGNLGDGTNAPHARPIQVGTATDWIDVDARTDVACGIRSDHSMWCWGFGTTGQLGDGMNMTEYAPTKVISDKPGMGWKAMSTGRQAQCGIHDDGSLACWGLDRIAGKNTLVPTAVGTDTDWTAISVGTVMCGLRGSPGHLYCWGKSTHGELGLGTTTSQATPVQVGTDTWKFIAVGYYNTCGIRSDGALLCSGNNPMSGTVLQYGTTPQQVGTATDWQQVSLSSGAIIGLRAGNAYGWGINDLGQLGIAPVPEIAEPTPLSGTVTGWSAVRSGNTHGCGIASGQAYCWGDFGEGNLGNGISTAFYAPTKIGSDRWIAIAGGGGQCGLRSDNALLCWGSGGGVGFGNTDPVWAPARLGTDTWSAVTGASGSFTTGTCAIRGGAPYCWGDNTFGQLGIDSQGAPQLSPAAVAVPPGSKWTEIAISFHTCAIKDDATLWCWGANDTGQLGTGVISTAPTLAPSAPLAGAWLHVAVAPHSQGSSAGMTCGIKADHTLWCWGQDQYPAMAQHLVPTQVGSDASWDSLSMASVSFSFATTCAVKLDHTLWCWGRWLGDGTMNSSVTPVQVGTGADWKSVTVGGEICAIKTGGTLWCWANQSVLGDGRPPPYDLSTNMMSVALVPTQIGTDTDWTTAMTSGSLNSESCAIKADGSLWCWGYGAAPIPGLSSVPLPIH